MFTFRRLWITLGLGLVVLFISLLIFRIDLPKMLQALKHADYYLAIPALLMYFLAVMFRALRWRYLLLPIKKLTAPKLYRVVVMGYMANNILPARIGEILRAIYLGNKENISKTAVGGTIALERVSDGIVLLIFAASASLFLPMATFLEDIAIRAGVSKLIFVIGIAVPFTLALVMLWMLASPPRWFIKIAVRLSYRLPGTIRGKVLPLAILFTEGLASLKTMPAIAWLLGSSIMVWISEGSMYLIMGYAFGLNELFHDWSQFLGTIILITGLANLAVSLPFFQGGIGLFEGVAVSTLVILGVGEELAFAYALALHLLLLVPVTLLGLLFFWLENISIFNLKAYDPTLLGEFPTTSPTGKGKVI